MTRKTPTTVYLGLGTNLGQREQNLRQALARLGKRVTIDRVSSFHDTEPVGYVDQPRFLNAVCRGKTDLGAEQLFRFVKDIEADMGRVPTFRNGPRVIDIDILIYGDLVLKTPELEIPHPRMAERIFVLAPLAEIDPGLAHPALRQTVGELLQKWRSAAEASGAEA